MGRYRVVEVHVETTSPQAELKLELRADGVKLGTCVTSNGRCHLALDVAVDERTRLDLDVGVPRWIIDRWIGSATLAEPQRWRTGVPLAMAATGQLRTAEIVLEDPPPWWVEQRFRLIGAAAGIAAALVALALFRRWLFAPRGEDGDPPILTAAAGAAPLTVAGAFLEWADGKPAWTCIAWGAAGFGVALLIARIVRARRVGWRDGFLAVQMIAAVTLMAMAVHYGLIAIAIAVVVSLLM